MGDLVLDLCTVGVERRKTENWRGGLDGYDRKDSFDKGTHFVLKFYDREGWHSKTKTDVVRLCLGSSSWSVRSSEVGIKFFLLSDT